MSDSILTTTKKALGIDALNTDFDVDVIMHINSVLSILTQMGLGPDTGLTIVDDTVTWDAFGADDPLVQSIKTYVYLRVRLLFDPPATSFAITAMEKQIDELGYRLNTQYELTNWTAPDPNWDYATNVPIVLDGGTV